MPVKSLQKQQDIFRKPSSPTPMKC